ncbi:MAG: class I SAM-dependent methyltransferase [Deltaproteobacteria bacterium]|nr:class I SAM-dependent methyltransferase [Deltaproteobacteria bacterium]
MSVLERVVSALREPRLGSTEVDTDDLIRVHREVLGEKPMLREVFRELYAYCWETDQRLFSGDGLRIELGAGVSLFKKFYPDVVSTDIKRAPHLDRVLDAQNMDLADHSVRAVYGINCFHHFPDPERFFAELQRVLVPGGGCVLIEPFHGPLAGFFYRNMFKTEHFNKAQKEWTGSDMGVMTGANQALSHIVFVRDRARFESRFPSLEIVREDRLPSYVRYILSGGLNFRSLVPGALAPALKGIETLLKPADKLLALHHAIVLRKRP